jgi:GTP-binding protein HflX
LLSDTVGFIRRLPERLFASFESTLAEVAEASLLLVAVDLSDPEARDHLDTTEAILDKLAAGQVPRLVVFNKLDRLSEPPDPQQLAAWSREHPYVALSSRDETAAAALRERILASVRAHQRERELFVPYAAVEITRQIYAQCRVLRATATPNGTQFVIAGSPHIVDEIVRAARRNRS